MPLPFNKTLDIKLLKLVKENPILYDVKHMKYMDFDSREVVWQKIGDELNRPAVEFAGLQCQILYGDYQEEKQKAGGYTDYYKELLPRNLTNKSGIDKKISKEHMKHRGLSSLDAKHLYTKTARALPTYGVTFFVVKEKQQKGKKKLVPRLLGISANAILRLDEETKEILQAWPLTQVRSYQVGKSHTFTLDFGDYSDKEYSVKSNDAVRIRDILHGYIDIIAKSRAGAHNHTMNDGSTIMEDSVMSSRGNVVQLVQNNPSKVFEESFIGPSKIVSYEPGQTVSQGTQLVTVQQVIVTNKMANQQYTVTGEVPHRKGMSLQFVKKLNRMNSNSVKVVNLITSEDGPHNAELINIVNTMENDLPLLITGVNDIVKTADMDEDAKKRLESELQELTDFINSLSKHVNGPNPTSDEALEAASRIADVSTQMYLGLDPLTKRRSNLVRMSRQSFILDDKMDASLRRASFMTAADAAHAVADKAAALVTQEYDGPPLTSSQLQELEKAAQEKMRKLNGAVALFLTAHADLENVDYPEATKSVNAINELMMELAKDAQALASSKDGASKQELIADIKQLCEAIKLVCALAGCDDQLKKQDVTNAYAPAADKLIFTFGRGRRDDRNNRIIDLAKVAGEKTSLLLMKANSLTELLPAPHNSLLDEAGVQCAAAGSDLLAVAVLTSPCINEPHCQSALTASAETLASSAQKLLLAAKPAFEEETLRSHGEQLRDKSLDLASALDALKNAYGDENISIGYETVVKETEHTDAVKDPQRLKFVMKLKQAAKDLDEMEQDINKPLTGEKAPPPHVVAMLEKALELKMAEYNAAVADLLVATSDRENQDLAAAEVAIVKIHEALLVIVKDMKQLAANKDSSCKAALLRDAAALAAATRLLCARAETDDVTELNSAGEALAKTSNKLCFTFNKTTPLGIESEIVEMATAAAAKASCMLSNVDQLAQDASPKRRELLAGAGAALAEKAKTLLTCAQLTASSPRGSQSVWRAAAALAAGGRALSATCSAARSPLLPGVRQLQVDLEDDLNNLMRACGGDKGKSPSEEKQRLQFVNSAAAAKKELLAMASELNEPSCEPPLDGKALSSRQRHLSERLARLNAALAALAVATSDPVNPDYAAAEEAMTTINETLPQVMKDTKLIAESQEQVSGGAALPLARALCAAFSRLCEHADDPKELREASKKFGAASGKLVCVLNPKTRPEDANKVINYANEVCITARQLVKDANQLADSLYASDLAAPLIRMAGAGSLDAVDALLTATQLTAPSLNDTHCQAALLSSLEALHTSVQDLAQRWAPIQSPEHAERVRMLDELLGELLGKLDHMRDHCLANGRVPYTVREGFVDRERFAVAVATTKTGLKDIEEELTKPHTGTIPKGQALAFRQLQLSNGLALLNASLASLAVSTTDLDKADYAGAEEAMNVIRETLPQVIIDTKAMAAARDDASGEAMLAIARTLCLATAQICDHAADNPKALRQFAKNFATASGKLLYRSNSRSKQRAQQVMESTEAACKTANQLVKTSSRLADQLAPIDDVRQKIAESGVRTADAADALMTAAQLTSPCITDVHCQASFATSIDCLSSSAQELKSHWLPLLQEPLLTAVIRQLENESQQLTDELGQLKEFCQDPKKAESIVHKPATKPKPPAPPRRSIYQEAKHTSDEEAKKISDEQAIKIREEEAKKISEEEAKQFSAALEKVARGLKAAEEDLKKVYDSPLAAPNMRKDQVRGIQKALEKKIALSNVATSSLLASNATEPMDYAVAVKSTADLATLLPKIAQDAKVLGNTMPEKQRKAFLDDILAMFDSTRNVIDAAQNNRQNLNGVAVEFGNKSSALLYSVCTDFDPSHEKEVISRAKAIGECISSLTECSAELISASEGDGTLCARGKACVTAAGNLVYTAKLVAPSIQVQECREILMESSQILSNEVTAFSDAWQLLSADPKLQTTVREMNAISAKTEGLLEELKKDLDSGKLVKMRPLEVLEVEDTPLRKMAAALVDGAMKKSTNSSLLPEQKRAYVEYGRLLTDASDRLDRANAVCKKEPHDLEKRRELEDTVQSLLVLALQSRPTLEDQQKQLIVDLTEYVKELSQEAEKMSSTAASSSVKHQKIDKECQEINKEAERLMQPSNHHVRGDDTTVDDIHEVERFGMETEGRIERIASEIQALPDSKDKILLNTQSVNLEDSCNILRFASQSAIATAQSAALDDTLHSLTEVEGRIDDMLDGRHGRIVNEPIPWAVRSSLLQAVCSVPSQQHLTSSLMQYVDEQRARTDVTDPNAKKRLQEHLRKLTYYLRVLTVETGRRVATWQELRGPSVATITEQVIKEIDYGCSLHQPKVQNSVLEHIDLNRLLLPSDVIKIEGDGKQLEDKVRQTANKLSSTLSTAVSSCGAPESLARSLAVSASAAGELAALAQAQTYTNPTQKAKIEETVRDITFQTYNVLKAAEIVNQEPNNSAYRRRLLDACRSLNEALNNLGRTTSTEKKMQRECSELTRNLQLNQTLSQTAQPTCALSYADCLDALVTQQEIIQKLNSDQPMSKEEFSRTLGYVSSAICNSTELATHCGYLMSLPERDSEVANIGVVDVPLLKKVTETARASCYRVLQFDTEQAKEEAISLLAQTQAVTEALQDAEKKSLHMKDEIRSASRQVTQRATELGATLAQNDKAKISAATTNLLDSLHPVIALTDHPALVPTCGDITEEQKQRQQTILTAARDLNNKTVSLIRDVKTHVDRHGDDDDEPMTWVTFNLMRKDVVKAFENLLANVRENGQKAGILKVEQKEEEPTKSYVQIQVELANKWLKRPNCKPEVKVSGEEAVRKIIDVAEKMAADMKESEREDMCVMISETKDLLGECSEKCTLDKASALVDRVKSLKKAIERGVITMVVEELMEGEEPLQDLEILADSESDASKRKFLLERKLADLLARLARVTRTACALERAGLAAPRDKIELNCCTQQANLLAPLLVKAAQERIESPDNKAAIENYQAMLAKYAESLTKVRELCDRSVDPMEFVQTAGETMQRMREESSNDNDPQKCVYASSAITRLANRVINVSMSSNNAKQDPELRKALTEAQQRLLAAVPGPDTRRSRIPDWKDTTAEILRTTEKVEAVMGGELIFQNQQQTDQPIFAAARNLHSVVREWSARDNELVAVAKRTAVLMARLSAHMSNNAQHEVLVTSQQLVSSSREVAELARKLAMECQDLRIKNNLLQVCDQIPTISGQLKMLTTVKGSSLNSGNKENQESLNMLVDNAQNLMQSIQQVVAVSAGAAVKIAAQRAGLRVRWLRKTHY